MSGAIWEGTDQKGAKVASVVREVLSLDIGHHSCRSCSCKALADATFNTLCISQAVMDLHPRAPAENENILDFVRPALWISHFWDICIFKVHYLKEGVFPHPATLPILLVPKAWKMKEGNDELINISRRNGYAINTDWAKWSLSFVEKVCETIPERSEKMWAKCSEFHPAKYKIQEIYQWLAPCKNIQLYGELGMLNTDN